VLVFPDESSAPASALAEAEAAAAGAPVAGMSADGLVTPGGWRPAGCAAIALGPEVAAGVGVATGAGRDPRAAGRAAAEAAVDGLDLPPGRSGLLLFLDPEAGEEGDAIEGAYEVVGGRVPLAGGGAHGPRPALYGAGVAAADAVVAVALRAPGPLGVGIAHGCRPRSFPAVVTRAEGRHVLELDGRPAALVYLEALGRHPDGISDEEFERLAVLHPLAQPELRGALRLRHVHGRAPDGGLACTTHVPPNAAVWFTEQTIRTIVDSAAEAVHDALEAIGGPARAALVFDCAARQRALGPSLGEEAATLVAAFGEPTPALAGLYTRGEVGRARGAKGDRNHAVVVVALG